MVVKCSCAGGELDGSDSSPLLPFSNSSNQQILTNFRGGLISWEDFGKAQGVVVTNVMFIVLEEPLKKNRKKKLAKERDTYEIQINYKSSKTF